MPKVPSMGVDGASSCGEDAVEAGGGALGAVVHVGAVMPDVAEVVDVAVGVDDAGGAEVAAGADVVVTFSEGTVMPWTGTKVAGDLEVAVTVGNRTAPAGVEIAGRRVVVLLVCRRGLSCPSPACRPRLAVG